MAMVKTTDNPTADLPPTSTGYSLDQYVQAATRENTRRSYQFAIEHFEVTWGGFLPTTAEQVARYLVDHAEQLAISTLRQRLAALAVWHTEQGFPDPTKAPVVKKVLKGIRELHPHRPSQAMPLQIEQLTALIEWMNGRIQQAERDHDRPRVLAWSRNRALVLIGFWRGFRSDELCRMRVEHTEAALNQGIRIYLPRSKADRDGLGETFQTPALAQLCPVQAYIQWMEVARLEEGPVFQGINRWGQLSGKALHPNSLIALLRTWLAQAGIEGARGFSSHSLRRGFASWASSNQWDLKALMEYVGWKDVSSALRYIDLQAPFQNAVQLAASTPVVIDPQPKEETLTLEVYLTLERYHKGVRSMKKAREGLERFYLQPYRMQKVDHARYQYLIQVPYRSGEDLDEWMGELLQDMHDLAQNHQCLLDIAFKDPENGRFWD